MANLTATLVCIGKFHLFALARELIKHRMLKCIFSGYPSWKLRDEDIPADRLKTYPWLQTPYMALNKCRFLEDGLFQRELAWLAHETLDYHVATHLPDSAVLFVLSGSGLACGRKAQSMGTQYICDRGSSHILFQDAILRKEFSLWGETFAGIDSRLITKEESEYETADIVTVPSTFALRSFLRKGVPESKLRKVPYGVDLRLFKKVADPDPDAFNILFLGQVSFRKGIPYLIEAFRLLKHPKKKLLIVGGMRREMVRYFKSRHMPDNMKMLGYIPQPELKKVISRSHVMVLPSVEDGFGLVMAQALACGCPVIGTRHTGGEDLFSDGREGFIVPIRDPHAISEKLQLLVDDPNRRAIMSEAALERVKALDGWTEYGNRMAQMMAELADKS